MSTTAMQETTNAPTTSTGDFVWYELRTPDAKGALDFYTHVVGWEPKPSGDPGGIPYTLLSVQGSDIAGVMQMTPEMMKGGLKPAWVGFIAVNDVDAYVKRVEQGGGKLYHPAQDIPGVGRWASVADPQGAEFLLFKGNRDQAPPKLPIGTPGAIGWHELSANDGEAAWPFYSNLFGWKEDTLMDMGPMGTYRIFNLGGPQVGAMMSRDPSRSPVPFWLYYVNVADIDTAAARIAEKQGQVFMGPHEVPGGLWILMASDPQGAMFAVVGPRAK